MRRGLAEDSAAASESSSSLYAVELPDVGLALRVATARNVRVAADGRDAATLSPDVMLELRRADILAGEDRLLAEVLAHLASD